MTENKSIEKLMRLNRFQYDSLGDVSVVDQRRLIQVAARKNSYTPSEIMEWEISTGSSYVYGPTSYLVLEVEATTTGGSTAAELEYYGDSVSNLFSSVLLRKEKDIERVEHLNLLNNHLIPHTNSYDHLYHGGGTVQGFNKDTAIDLLNNKTELIIPLSSLGGFWNNEEQLIPSYIISSAVLQVTLETAKLALKTDAADANITYTVTNPVLHLDSFDLIDPARLFLARKASTKQGIIYTYGSVFHRQVDNPGSSLSANVGRGVAHLLWSMAVRRQKSVINDETKASFRSLPMTSTNKYRYKLGSVHIPDRMVQGIPQAYMMSQHTFDKIRDRANSSAVDVGAYSHASRAHATMTASYERSHLSKLSGVSVSNARALYLDWEGTTVADAVIDVFSAFVRVAAGYSDNRIKVLE